MIELYTASTFNGQRASIMLQECDMSYTAHKVNLLRGEQRSAEFLKLNPSARIPVLVDKDTDDGKPFVLTQSIAILQYLAEKSGMLLPESLQARARVYEWMHFHAVDIGSVIYSAFYLEKLCEDRQADAARILRERIHKLYAHFDKQLQNNHYLAGDEYSIADIAVLPAVLPKESQFTEYRNMLRWMQALKERPAVQKGMALGND